MTRTECKSEKQYSDNFSCFLLRPSGLLNYKFYFGNSDRTACTYDAILWGALNVRSTDLDKDKKVDSLFCKRFESFSLIRDFQILKLFCTVSSYWRSSVKGVTSFYSRCKRRNFLSKNSEESYFQACLGVWNDEISFTWQNSQRTTVSVILCARESPSCLFPLPTEPFSSLIAAHRLSLPLRAQQSFKLELQTADRSLQANGIIWKRSTHVFEILWQL